MSITYRPAFAVLIAAMLGAAISLADRPRQVAVLHFTALSCGPCGGAALAMERLKHEAGESLSVIGVHYYDSYKIPEAESLAAHYSVIGTPTTWFDGVDVQYYADTATYWGYRSAFDKRKFVSPGADIALDGWADTAEGIGTLTCTVFNPTTDTVLAILRTAIIERAIYRPWGGGDSVYDVLRRMLPAFHGPEIRLEPGADTSLNFPFSIAPEWNSQQLVFAAWAEKTDEGKAPGAGSIMQSARIDIGQLWGVNSEPPPGLIFINRLSASIYPNPLRDRGLLQFILPRPGRVTANFYDISGRRLGNIDLGWREAGEHLVEFDARKWPTGFIFCLLINSSNALTIKAVKLN